MADFTLEANELGVSVKTYTDLFNLIARHITEEGDYYRNIRRMWQTKSGVRIVMRNVLEDMRVLDCSANAAVAHYEQELTNENY